MLEIVKYPNEILRERMPEFDFNNPVEDPILLEKSMIETMNAARGMGLSACQVGKRLRMFVMIDSTFTTEGKAFFNPVILETTDATTALEEGCLSFPKIFVKVNRPTAIKSQWQNSKGEIEQGVFEGYECRCFLHELDHLEGIVYRDRVSSMKWHIAKKKSAKRNA